MRRRSIVVFGAAGLISLCFLSVFLTNQPARAGAGLQAESAAKVEPVVPAVRRAAATPRALAANSAGGVISNGWELVFTAPAYAADAPFYFYNLTFASRSVGYAYGGDEWDASPGYPGRIFRTTDGGQTWVKVLESGKWKIDMACTSESKCWVGGKGGAIDYTSDRGATWSRAHAYTWYGLGVDGITPQPTVVPFTGWIRSAGATTDGSAVVFGASDNTILHSTDGVDFYNYWPLLIWNVATWSVTCPSSSVCYGGQIGAWVLKSTDGGSNWTMPAYVLDPTQAANCLPEKYPEDNGIQRRYYGLGFADANYGWAVGSCGAIYRTTNGAASRWTAQNAGIPQEIEFRDVKLLSKTKAVAVGGRWPDPAIPADTMHAAAYITNNGSDWVPAAAPDTDALMGLAAFTDATYVADWSGHIWRWNGALLPVEPTPTSTPTPRQSVTPTATATGTETATATPTDTTTPTATPETGEVRVTAFVDANDNDTFDAGETPLPDVRFALKEAGQVPMTQITDAAGVALFSAVAPGSYVLAQTEPLVGYSAAYSQLVVSARAGQMTDIGWPFTIVTPTVTPTATRTKTPTATATLTSTPAPQVIWLPLLLK